MTEQNNIVRPNDIQAGERYYVEYHGLSFEAKLVRRHCINRQIVEAKFNNGVHMSFPREAVYELISESEE